MADTEDTIRLALPSSIGLEPARRVLHWLKRRGEEVEPLEPLATLDGALIVRAPVGLSGVLEKHLAAEASLVMVGEPFARIRGRPPSRSRHRTDDLAEAESVRHGPGLAEPSTVAYSSEPNRAVVARTMQSKDTYMLAAVGAAIVLGFVVVVVAFVWYLLLGGVGALLTSGMAFSVVAGALSYGEYRLRHGDA
jgi:hypothetical protein